MAQPFEVYQIIFFMSGAGYSAKLYFRRGSRRKLSNLNRFMRHELPLAGHHLPDIQSTEAER